jgi:hypothetical protein
MPVIVFNKRTGKYLQRHSGSYRRKWHMMRYKKGVIEEITKKFGPCPLWRKNSEAYAKYQSKLGRFLRDSICNAEPGDARVYATKGSATASVGAFNRDRIGHRTYVLPDYFEIHEIKEAFVCVMRPDGSSNCDDEEAK